MAGSASAASRPRPGRRTPPPIGRSVPAAFSATSESRRPSAGAAATHRPARRRSSEEEMKRSPAGTISWTGTCATASRRAGQQPPAGCCAGTGSSRCSVRSSVAEGSRALDRHTLDVGQEPRPATAAEHPSPGGGRSARRAQDGDVPRATEQVGSAPIRPWRSACAERAAIWPSAGPAIVVNDASLPSNRGGGRRTPTRHAAPVVPDQMDAAPRRPRRGSRRRGRRQAGRSS